MKIIATLLLVLLGSGTCFAETVTVAISKAELRSKPSVGSSRVVMTVRKGYPLEVQSREDRYLMVRDYEGTRGWIHKSLVTNLSGVVVKAAGANVRKGPDKTNTVVFQAQRGDTYQVLSERDDWLQIFDDNGREGWIFKSLTWGY